MKMFNEKYRKRKKSSVSEDFSFRNSKSNNKKIEKIKKKTKELIMASTSHGLPNIFRTNRIIFKLMWFILFLLSTALGINTVIGTVNTYLNYEIVTKIDVITEIPTNFPAITIINLRNKKMNISLNELMIYCNFNLEECDENDFEMIVDNFGFVSYIFKPKKSYTPGMQYGLQILINLENITCNNCYLDGLRLIVHNHTADPGYYSGGTKSGFILSPGFNHEIIVKRTFLSKLGLPFNNCIKNVTSLDTYDSDLYRYILESTKYKYTQKDCFDYCMGTELNKYFNITNKTDHWLNIYKTYTFDGFWDFYSNFVRGENKKVCTPLCPLECDSIKYDISISFTKFSSNEFLSLYEINVNVNNLISIDIYYENLEYTNISQLPKMDLFDLISNIGSNLSLFIGISFLSFAEIIEIIGEILIILFQKKQPVRYY
jgi:hypothetical protein